MGVSPAPTAAATLARTSVSVSPWSVRRSEWPRITQAAPASRSIAAETSPVWAPFAWVWQSCPPTATTLPASASATGRITVAGGQTSRSQARPGAASATARASDSESATRPFIFQLPAMSWRIPLPFPLFPSLLPQGGWQTKGRGPMVRRFSLGFPYARNVSPRPEHLAGTPVLLLPRRDLRDLGRGGHDQHRRP
ncbi:protein of unknown function [Rhodovastum atsumiense]|nr:protein of unknown function [Rhodovastum atsumiense]